MRIKNILMICASAFFISASLHAHGSSSHKKSDRHTPSIVGTYTLSLTYPGGIVGYGNISFHEGGTLHGSDSLALGQSLPGIVEGALFTVWTGNWEKIDKETYRIFFTSVAAVKNPADCCPSFPAVRLKVEGTVSLSCCGQVLSSNLEASTWALNDLTLNTNSLEPPVAFPFSGRRVPSK